MDNKFSKKITIVFLGILTALLVLEGGLRTIGLISEGLYAPDIKKKNADYVIMNVGNSYTYGLGAPPGQSYSDQLNNLLKKRTDKTYQVINRGKTNANTSLILESLDAWLDQDKPNLVFLMVGEPNHWNKYGYWEFLGKRSDGNLEKGLLDHLDFLRWSKIYKLIELLANRNEGANERKTSVVFKLTPLDEEYRLQLGYQWIGGLQNEAMVNIVTMSKEEQQEAISALSYVFEKDKNPMAAYYLAEITALHAKDAESSLKHIENSINQSENFDYNQWIFLANYKQLFVPIYKDRYEKLVTKLKSKIDPAFLKELVLKMQGMKQATLNSLGGNFLYQANKYNPLDTYITKLYVYKKWEEEPIKSFEMIERTLRVNPLSYNSNLFEIAEDIVLRHPELEERYRLVIQEIERRANGVDVRSMVQQSFMEKEWIEHDLELMIAKIKKRGAQVVVQTYPPYRKSNPRHADVILRTWWKNRRDKTTIRFQDSAIILESDFSAKNGGQKYYSTDAGPHDEHLNALGYGVIARLMESLVP